ncbi:nitrate regulatory gene2 protein-like protein, partial [Tanacetum coccineum]
MAPFVDCVELLAMMVQSRPFACQHILGVMGTKERMRLTVEVYHNLKVDEKMRLEHDEKDRRLKRLDEKGAEQQKIDATRILARNLSTRIRITTQVVDKISTQIDRLRDEELWPQLNERRIEPSKTHFLTGLYASHAGLEHERRIEPSKTDSFSKGDHNCLSAVIIQ